MLHSYLEEIKKSEIIKTKELTPAQFKMAGMVFSNSSQIIAEIKKKQIGISDILVMMARDCENVGAIIPRKKNMLDFPMHQTYEIIFSPKTVDVLKVLPSQTVNSIGKDFGEILGPIFLLNKFDAKEISYPAKSNEKLVDFYIEGQPVSSKYKGGSWSSLQNIYDKLQENPDIAKQFSRTTDGKKFLAILDNVVNNPAGFDAIECHKTLNTPFFRKLNDLGLIGNTFKETASLMTTYLEKMIQKTHGDPKKILNILSREVYITSIPNIASIEKNLSNPKKYGILGFILGPAAAEMVNVLNQDHSITSSLKQIINVLNIKQLRFTITTTYTKALFEIQSFAASTPKFGYAGSVPYYARFKLAFKI